jgi:glutamyl/glutaminyl-tRNA synthetase
MPLSKDGLIQKLGETEIRVFPISTLANELSKALGESRTTQTVRKWEVYGIIPPALFKHKGRRVYTMEQIKCICNIAKEENIRQGYSLSMTSFSQRVTEELRKINKKYIDIKNGVKKGSKKNGNASTK